MNSVPNVLDAAGGAPTGVEQLRLIQAVGRSAVGVADLLEMDMDTIEEGHVVFTVRTRPAFGNPMGGLHGGITATLLDSAMGCAVFSVLPADTAYTTVDLNISYLRPVPLDGTRLWAHGDVVHHGRTIATASGRLVDENGRLIATAVTTCLVMAAPQQETHELNNDTQEVGAA